MLYSVVATVSIYWMVATAWRCGTYRVLLKMVVTVLGYVETTVSIEGDCNFAYGNFARICGSYCI